MDCYEGDNKVDGQHLNNYYVTPPPQIWGQSKQVSQVVSKHKKKNVYIYVYRSKSPVRFFAAVCVLSNMSEKKPSF